MSADVEVTGGFAHEGMFHRYAYGTWESMPLPHEGPWRIQVIGDQIHITDDQGTTIEVKTAGGLESSLYESGPRSAIA